MKKTKTVIVLDGTQEERDTLLSILFLSTKKTKCVIVEVYDKN